MSLGGDQKVPLQKSLLQGSCNSGGAGWGPRALTANGKVYSLRHNPHFLQNWGPVKSCFKIPVIWTKTQKMWRYILQRPFSYDLPHPQKIASKCLLVFACIPFIAQPQPEFLKCPWLPCSLLPSLLRASAPPISTQLITNLRSAHVSSKQPIR